MINCVAIDDEPIALAIIKEYCSRYGDIRLECFTSPVEGMEYIKTSIPEIVFLDIEMNSQNGMRLAKILPRDTLLIFTTAYSQYALDGFNVDAIDFLHKPIFYPRFKQAMAKAAVWMAVRGNITRSSHEVITLKSGYKNVVIELNSITHIEAMDNYVKVYRKNMSTVISQITMMEMESLLPDDSFIRVHRSFIVSFGCIDRFSNRKIYLHEIAVPIPVGRKYNDRFTNKYNLFRTVVSTGKCKIKKHS